MRPVPDRHAGSSIWGDSMTRRRRLRKGAKAGFTGSAALLLAGCTGAQSALDIRGSGAGTIADIWWPMLAVGTVIYLLVAVIVLFLLFRRNQAQASRDNTRLAKRWIILGGIVLPTIVLVPLFVASARTLKTLMHATAGDLTVHVTGHQYWWEIRYKRAGDDIVAANEIHIPTGQRVRLELTTADVIHSLWIPNLQGKTDLVPGQRNVMWIDASRAGISRAQCAEYCGTQHALMALPVVAESPAAFDAWTARERLPASSPANTAASAGASAFISVGCGTCHTIRGTAAGGTRGPDLTHLGSRSTLAAGTLDNTSANLTRWLSDPQAIKPGNKMPRVPLSPQQLSSIVDYLRTLH